jgi:hypothetical protein
LARMSRQRIPRCGERGILGLPPLAQSSAPRDTPFVRILTQKPPAAARSPPKLYSYAAQSFELRRWHRPRYCCAAYSVQQGETRCSGLGRICGLTVCH